MISHSEQHTPKGDSRRSTRPLSEGNILMRAISTRLTILMVLALFQVLASQTIEAQERGGRRGGGFNRGGGMGRGGFGGGRSGLLGALSREEIQTEINLTAEQSEKFEALREKVSEQSRELFSGMRDASPEERQELFEKARDAGQKLQAEAEAELKTILTADQATRLQQVSWQLQGARALDNEEVNSQLKLSAEQLEQISAIVEEANESRRGSFGGRRRGTGGDRPSREEQRAELDAKLVAVLTPEQQQQWTAMLGPTVEGLNESRRRGGNSRRNRSDRDRSEEKPDKPKRTQTEAATPSNLAPTDGTVVADLSAAPKTPEVTESAQPADDENLLSFNFRYAPWEMVLRRFAEEAQLNLQMDVVPPGTLNYFDKGRYTPTQALDVLNGYLLQKGYLLVRRDRFLVVVNIDDGIPPNLVPQVTVEELQNRGNNELVSIVVSLPGTDTETVSEEVTAMLGPQGKVVPMANLSRLVITDTGGNLRRIHRLLVGDNDGPKKSQKFRAFPLKYVSAIDADKIVRDLFGLPARGSANNVSAASSSNSASDRYSRFRGSRDRGRDDRRESSRTPPAPASTTGDAVRLAIDERTNSLLVTASPENLLIVEEALQSVDVGEGPGGVAIGGSSNRPQLEVYEVQSADPREVTKTLDALLPGVVVNEDGRARRIHILATPDEHRQIRAIIDQLDGAGSGQGVTVVNLTQLDPLAAAGTLRSLFEGDGDSIPTIEPDLAGRRLLIRGTTEQLAQIKTLLAQLGEDGTRQAGVGTPDRGPIRTISLGGRDGGELIKLLQQVWGESSKNPIRVVVPSAVAPTMRSESPEQSKRKPVQPIDAEPAVLRRESSEADVDESLENESSDSDLDEDLDAFLDELEEGVDAEVNDAETNDEVAVAPTVEESTTQTGAPIVIAPNGGNLIIASEDAEALNRVENLIEALARAAPRKRQWTVFYLRSSDALETASTLAELFPAGSVATPAAGGGTSLVGSLSSLGGSLMDMSGLSSLGAGTESLRIIPEPRLNALFVSGPAAQIDEIENVLKILDGGDLPESLRERLPRRIALEHADVNEVAAIVREVYKDYMEEPDRGRRGGGGGNPLAMMLGGGQQQASAPGAGIKLTLGVDARTNTLIVAASNALFEQIAEMVESIDQSAADAQQTVRVVPIDANSAPLIEQSLGSLFGKIKVSTTTGSARASKPAESSNNSSSGSADEQRSNEIRQFFERRMRERMQGGGDRGRGGRGRRSERSGGRGGFSGARGERRR